jgi:hypothetical protein
MRNGITPKPEVVKTATERVTLAVALDGYKEYVRITAA